MFISAYMYIYMVFRHLAIQLDMPDSARLHDVIAALDGSTAGLPKRAAFAENQKDILTKVCQQDMHHR